MRVAKIIRTGVANVASVLASLHRLGLETELSEKPEDVLSGDLVVLPGVGAFGAGAEALRERKLDEAIRNRILNGRPTLAVCLGLQLLFEQSEESPGARGLGIFPGAVRRFSNAAKVPQLGWNRIDADPSCAALQTGYVYFANSYCVTEAPKGAVAAVSDYGQKFIAGFEVGGLLACQFHPELSGTLGEKMLSNWAAGFVGGSKKC